MPSVTQVTRDRLGTIFPQLQSESEMVCPHCQTNNVADARFCMNCGNALPAAGPAREAPLFHDVLRAPKPVPTAGERRIITALFCDVVRSTALAEGLDPEEWREIMNRAFAILTERGKRAIQGMEQADSITLELASGQSITIPTDAQTTWHERAAATAADVTTGSTVIVQLAGGRQRADALGRSRRRPGSRADFCGPLSVDRKRAAADLRGRRRRPCRLHVENVVGFHTF